MLEGLDEGEAEGPEGDVVGDVFAEVSGLVLGWTVDGLLWGGGKLPGAPTEPKKMASYLFIRSSPPSGIYRPCFL